MSTSNYTKLALAATALIAMQSPSFADLSGPAHPGTYHLTVCGGSAAAQPGSPCYANNGSGSAQSGAVDALTNESFDQYFTNTGFVISGLDYSFTIDGGSGNFLYGRVESQNNLPEYAFVSSFGWVILADTTSLGLTISGINDNGVMIGHNGQQAISSDPWGPYGFNQGPWNLDEASLQYIASSTGDNVYQYAANARFVSIDNQNRISGVGGDGAFLLSPVSAVPATAVDEPASIGLLAAALLILGGTLRRKVVPPAEQ